MRELIDPRIYYSLFELNPDGKVVLEELCTIFYDCPSYTRGDQFETAFNEGKKHVIAFIIKKLNQSQGDQHNDDRDDSSLD